MNNLKRNVDPSVNIDSFFPRCFDLGDEKECHDFIRDFKKTTLIILLRRHLEYFKLRSPDFFEMAEV